ncbi:M28 family peptidase [Anaerocolumna xylanovorans]|uniref:Peptidase M28 domain-containing protein n=1 Tax=Anaerocolumna xylanovorans DSM 12503 TaxID=1121345 RepID=A0A1M7YNB6_9FIRM|nr:M28 family peptidase [Anaerocolumna xylanovorans]SHO54130.1 hypothetical protein SAMN02745217_04585 [Anaerocolumna xylanovorans DSM 12503]
MKHIKKQILSNVTERPLANNLERILRMSQKSLKRELAEELKRLGYRDIKAPNGFVYAQGEVPVLLVAHLDTVHKKFVKTICYSRDGNVMMSPEGIGGDDRAGVYMILQIIQNHSCHVLFCEDEEIGGHGARDFANSKIRPNVNYIVEMDRRGSNDAVFYNCANPEFVDFVCSFGFEEAIGSFSDISVIAPRLGIAAVNISAGYYNEHHKHESIDLEAVEHNIARISQMVQTPSEAFEYIERQFYGRLWQNSFEDMSLWDYIDREPEKKETKKLMPLPDFATLQINGQLLAECSRYMLDAQGKVYNYIPELNAAILSENTTAISEAGQSLKFKIGEARLTSVIPLETALELLQ